MANPLCPTGCNYSLAAVKFEECAPEVNFSEIQYIFIAKPNAAALADWTQPAEWATRLSQTSTSGDDYIRKLTVIADKPAPTGNVKEISADRTINVDKTHVINLTIDETNSTNFEFLRQLECGGQVKIWYQTKSGHLFGGNAGIKVTMILDMVLARGTGEIQAFNGTCTWKAKFTEERCVSPIVGGTSASYDTILTFAALTTDSDAGVGATVGSVDADLKFEFNAISPRTGTPKSMDLQLAAVSQIVVDYTSDYEDQAFRFTSAAGIVYTGVFTDGVVAL
jgi:hypothetical protein